MQKNGKDYSLQTIYIKKRDIKTLNLVPEKKALRHYLSTIEFMTRTSFFVKGQVPIASKNYFGISKNSFAPILSLYERTGILNFKKGLFGRTSFKYPEDHPKSQDEWLKVRGGFLKVDREELLSLIKKLSDNELRVYFSLKLIHEASYRDENRHLGIMTFPKTIRESHVKISQKTLRSCLDSLVGKGMITLAEPIDLDSRLKSRFLFCLVSQKVPVGFQEISAEVPQSPKNSLHLKKNIFTLGKILNQDKKIKSKVLGKPKRKTDFNFWGLDKLDRPLSIEAINRLINREGFTKEEVQESVMRFARYIDSDVEIRAQYYNPVGFLINHMKSFKQIFIEPEWWLELQHRVDLGDDRFKYKSKEAAVEASKVDSQTMGEFFADIMNVLNGVGAVYP